MEFYCGGACFRNFMRSKFSASIESSNFYEQPDKLNSEK